MQVLAEEGKSKAIAFDEIDKAPEEKARGITIATAHGAARLGFGVCARWGCAVVGGLLPSVPRGQACQLVSGAGGDGLQQLALTWTHAPCHAACS